MSLEGRDLSDTQILDATKMEHDPEMGHRLSVLLPSGRTLYSDYGPAEELRKRLIVWCESVRSSIDSDILASREEKTLLEARKQLEAVSVPERDDPAPMQEDDAEAYAARQVETHQAEVARLSQVHASVVEALAAARAGLTRWVKIKEALKDTV